VFGIRVEILMKFALAAARINTSESSADCFKWLYLQTNRLSCFTGHMDKLLSLTCTHDGIVCSGSLDHQVKLWRLDLIRGNETYSAKLNQHQDQITCVASCSDGSIVASASR
jgi:WD40 repeat protein